MNKTIIRFIIIFILVSIPTYKFPFLAAAQEKINAPIKQETEIYKKNLKKQENIAAVCDQLEKYQTYVDEALSILNKELWKNKQLYKKIEKYGKFDKNKVFLVKNKDVEIDKYAQFLIENGLKIGYSEGAIYLYFDPKYIVSSFKDVLPNNVTEYYAIEAEDVKEGFAKDAGLTIPWDAIRKRIVRYEAYLNKISKVNCLYLTTLTKGKISLYANTYVLGLDNSSIENNIIEAKSSYEKFLSENKASKYYGMIEKYYVDLKRNNFKFRRKEVVKDGYTYVGPSILDKNGKEVYVRELAEKYLKEAGITIVESGEER